MRKLILLVIGQHYYTLLPVIQKYLSEHNQSSR